MISTQPAIMQEFVANSVEGREAVIGVECRVERGGSGAHVGDPSVTGGDGEEVKAGEASEVWVSVLDPATGEVSIILSQFRGIGDDIWI